MCRFLTLAAETGGRFCKNSVGLMRELVAQKALSQPPALQRSASLMFTRRWWGILSVAVQYAVASTLVPEAIFGAGETRLLRTYPSPSLEELVGGHRVPPLVSRLR